jgi:hypothetical protein
MSLSSLFLINNKTSNKHRQPTIFFTAVGPRIEHRPRVPQNFKPRLNIMGSPTARLFFHKKCVFETCSDVKGKTKKVTSLCLIS